jgi:glycosyltransferase involved in cell wall biosynthesis
MNLCHIVPSLAAQRGGPSRSVRALCGSLADAGHSVDLLTTAEAAPAPEENAAAGRLRVRTFRRDWPERLCPSAGLRRALAGTDAAIVHHHALWLRTLHYAHRRTRRSGARLVVSPRGMMSAWAWRHRGWRKRLARALVHPGALDAVAGWHATSDEEAAEIRALGFTQPICVAPNGVEAPVAADTAAAAAHWRAACPALAGRRVALFYSRLHAKKRVLELIDVWLANAAPEWLLLLVGIPEDYTPDMLERYAAKMGGAGRIAVFAGTDRPAPYAVASVFLLPSHNENFGLVVAEAMAHGVPVLVTDTTPWRTVNDPGLGWCVPWNSYASALAAATAESADALARRGAAARDWVLREFAWSRSAATLAAFYRTLVPAAP